MNVADDHALFGPLAPVWDEAQGGGITKNNGRLVLHFRHDVASNVAFIIYQDGVLCAKSVHNTNWTDPDSGDYAQRTHSYAVAAVDLVTGNSSHLTPARSYSDGIEKLVFYAHDLENQGGNLVGGHHFENWGKSGDTLATKSFQVKQAGRYAIRAEFSNGMGPVNTGVTCGVKRLEILQAGSDQAVASGYLIMPQSGDWKRWDMSSPVAADLRGGIEYAIRIFEDEYSRNMSYLKQNERYTAWPGGGQNSCNYVNISQIQLKIIASRSFVMAGK